MKNFAFWRGAIFDAKTLLSLKAVGEDIAQFQKQTDLLGDGEKKLTEVQVETLRLEYSLKMKKLTAETLFIKQPGKPKFKK